ncbi:11 kDa protein [Potato latent virus]|uniref:RNA silencing suppressor n=1 Tax=Potato latent virus TaxID=138982 RepID=B1A9S9_9VIRU|nr:11 kDa protein [Potato latent virus]ACA05831.1 11 kDa protein [Potato latent virus]AXP79057.1 nucleic acid binding protein [Potato latent virus]QNN81554.1 NBP [Potato latent virus]QPD01722.1 NABP [Potato latent virus]WIW79790.1 nucleic acid binding protein [Potato latent virus]
MQPISHYEAKLLAVSLAMYKFTGRCEPAVALNIVNKACNVGMGKSSFARRRRAALLGRCHRCFRTSMATRCNGVTCYPGIGAKPKIEMFIKYGVSELKP